MLARALELAWGAQVVACGVYAYGILSRKGGGRNTARALLIASWVLGAIALGTRWRTSGLMQPPWLSLSETLVFASWVLLGLQLLAEFWQGASNTGFFTTAFSAAIVATVIFKLGGFGPHVTPHAAFRGPWLWIHLPSGAVAFGLMSITAFYSIVGWVRVGVETERMLSVLGALMVLSLCWVFPLDQTGKATLGGLILFLVLCILGFWVESLDRRLLAERELSGAKNSKAPSHRGAWRVTRWVFGVSWLGLPVVLRGMDGGRAPYLYIWLVFLAVMGAGALLLAKRRKEIQGRLPEFEHLDDLASQAVIQAFPWLTFHLVSGSVWAYEIWGSYWSWRPGQAWTLAAWLYLAMLLHLRPGKVSTAIARALALFWVMAAIGAGGAHGFWPAHV